MAGRSLGTLTVDLILKLGGFEEGLNKADRETKRRLKSMGDAFDLFYRSTAVSVAATVAVLTKLQKNAIDFGSAIADAAIQTGQSTKAIQELTYAGIQLGLTNDQIIGAMTKLSVKIGEVRTEGEGAVPAFERLGIAVNDVNGAALSNEVIFRKVVDRLNAIQDPAVRAANAFQIFGKEAGPKFAELISEGTAGLDAQAKAARDAGAILDADYLAALKRTNDELAVLDRQIDVNLTRAFGTSSPLIKLWKETLEGATKTLAEWRVLNDQAADDAAIAVALFGGSVTRNVEVLTAGAAAARDYLQVLQDIRNLGTGAMTPFAANDPLPLNTGTAETDKQRDAREKAAEKLQKDIEAAAQKKIEMEEATHDALLKGNLDFNEKLAAQEAEEKQRQIDFIDEISDYDLQNAEWLADEKAKLKERDLQYQQSIFADLTSLMASHSRKAFEIGKAAAIAQAAIDASKFILGAMADTGGNIYLRIAAGVAAAAAALVQINNIKNTNFGSRSVSASVSSGGAAGAGAGGAAPQPTITVRFSDDRTRFSRDELQEIFDGINDLSKDGQKIIVAGGG